MPISSSVVAPSRIALNPVLPRPSAKAFHSARVIEYQSSLVRPPINFQVILSQASENAYRISSLVMWSKKVFFKSLLDQVAMITANSLGVSSFQSYLVRFSSKALTVSSSKQLNTLKIVLTSMESTWVFLKSEALVELIISLHSEQVWPATSSSGSDSV